MKFTEQVAALRSSGIGEVKLETMPYGDHQIATAHLNLETSIFEAKGLGEAFVALTHKVDGYMTVSRWKDVMKLTISVTSEVADDVNRVEAEKLLARAEAQKAEDAAK